MNLRSPSDKTVEIILEMLNEFDRNASNNKNRYKDQYNYSKAVKNLIAYIGKLEKQNEFQLDTNRRLYESNHEMCMRINELSRDMPLKTNENAMYGDVIRRQPVMYGKAIDAGINKELIEKKA